METEGGEPVTDLIRTDPTHDPTILVQSHCCCACAGADRNATAHGVINRKSIFILVIPPMFGLLLYQRRSVRNYFVGAAVFTAAQAKGFADTMAHGH